MVIIILILLVVDVIFDIEINAKDPRGTKMWTHVIGRTASPRLTWDDAIYVLDTCMVLR